MIKVSHETPISLLDLSRSFNDYSYALPHLLDQNKEYRNFFIKEKELGREIYLDNSVHEKGVPYKRDKLLYWINELIPSNFFIPDFLEEKDKSIVQAKEWIKIQLPQETLKVAVIQAKSLGEAIECTQIYRDLGYKKLAFPYGSSYYNDLFPHPNEDFGKAMGRLMVISKLKEMKLLTNYTPIHLLGSSWPSEFKFYKGFKFIESLDTSNPIMAALEGNKYNKYGLENKPKLNLNQTQNWIINDEQTSLIDFNIYEFKKINNLI